MKMRTDAARLLVQRASWMASTGKKFENGEGSMSKLFAGETAVWVTEEAIQILGGYGYIRDYPVERWHRDSKIYTIFEGTIGDPAAGHRPGHLRGPHQLVDLGFNLCFGNSLAQVRKRAVSPIAPSQRHQNPSASWTRMAVIRSAATAWLIIRMLFTPLGRPYASRARQSSSGSEYSKIRRIPVSRSATIF